MEFVPSSELTSEEPDASTVVATKLCVDSESRFTLQTIPSLTFGEVLGVLENRSDHEDGLWMVDLDRPIGMNRATTECEQVDVTVLPGEQGFLERSLGRG